MRELAERGWFVLCLAIGALLRSAKYSTIQIVDRDGRREVRKRRIGVARALVWMGDRVFRMLDTGVRVLPLRAWHERERSLYQHLRRPPVRIDADGTLVLPFLAGETLAALLEHSQLGVADRDRAIELATRALADLHRLGFTHGDAMAENVMIDLGAGRAHWFDFETLHDPSRHHAWRRADDVRALLASCLLRTRTEDVARTLRLVLHAHRNDEITCPLIEGFAQVLRRSLAVQLGQAGLPYHTFRKLAPLLGQMAQAREPAA